MGPGGEDGSADPEVDPDILEELEFWTGPDEDPDEHWREDTDGNSHGDSEADGAQGARNPGAAGGASTGPGSVVVVGTPIGNLGDLSPRAVEALRTADVIYCEDTRHSRKLLTHAGISGVRLRSLHEHNEVDRIDEVIRAVGEGRTAALVSDAGMPGISDPGRRVVAAAAAAGLTVTVVPGPSAVLAALVASGLATDRFCFEGFLPRSGRERRERIATLAADTRTAVLFEAPSRVAATVRDLAQVCGIDRDVVIARELTKLHEEVWRGSLGTAAAWITEHPVRGEVVLVLDGAPELDGLPVDDGVLSAALAEQLAAGERTRGAVDEVASAFGVSRRRVYALALVVRNPDGSDDQAGPAGGPGATDRVPEG